MTIQCTICMSNLNVNEVANAATCGHVFHEPCLVQWFLRSKTCPQCRARCDERQVRRLYFSASLNNSTVDVDSLQVDLDDLKLELRNLNAELESKKKEIKRLRDRQETTKLAIEGMEAENRLVKVQLQNANCQIDSVKSELARSRAVEKDLNEKMNKLNNLEYIKSVIESDAVCNEVAEILKSQTDVKALAQLVSSCKVELRKVIRNRDEVKNHRRVCQEENSKLKKQIRELKDIINTLESDNYKLKDDLSQMRRNKEPNNAENQDVPSLSAQPISPAIRTAPNSSSTTRNESPYLNIRQSNVGLTPLLNRKRKPELETTSSYQNLTIFSNRQKMIRTNGVQSSNLIYNGFGGSEKKENFIGFPQGQSKTNPAGRGLSMPIGSFTKNSLNQK